MYLNYRDHNQKLLIDRCIKIVRNTPVPDGDQYGVWSAPLPKDQADAICRKLEALKNE